MGLGINLPTIELGGFFSSSWIYVVIVGIIGFMVLAGIGIALFFLTYNRRIILFENMSGNGYQPTMKTRARIVKLGVGGGEVLKTLIGGHYVTAYGRKMGKGTYWFAKGQDGYWYNFLLGDFDHKLGILDIEPVDRDVRMFHIATSRMAKDDYGKGDTMTKVMAVITIFILLVGIVGGFWVIAGKVNEGLEASAEASKINLETIKLANQVLGKVDNIKGGTGLVPADTINSITGGG